MIHEQELIIEIAHSVHGFRVEAATCTWMWFVVPVLECMRQVSQFHVFVVVLPVIATTISLHFHTMCKQIYFPISISNTCF